MVTPEAQKIVELHPDYNAYSNNCQNFVLHFLKFACLDPNRPRTIEHVVRDVFARLRLNEPRLNACHRQQSLSSRMSQIGLTDERFAVKSLVYSSRTL